VGVLCRHRRRGRPIRLLEPILRGRVIRGLPIPRLGFLRPQQEGVEKGFGLERWMHGDRRLQLQLVPRPNLLRQKVRLRRSARQLR